jgi:cytochrome c peroxidase
MKLTPIRSVIASRRAPYAVLVLSALASIGSLAQSVDERLGLPTEIRNAQSPDVRLSALGERLFFDKRFSADGSVSCATCHQPSHAFTDGLSKARGLAGQLGTRNAPSLYNASLADDQFWDGRQRSLEDQALEPFVNPIEHGLHDHGAVLKVIRRDPISS